MGSRLRPFLQSWLRHLEVERGLSANTLDAYARDGEAFLAFLDDGDGKDRVAPENLREKTVFDFLVHERQRGRDIPSVRRSLSALKTFFRFLVREKVLATNPAQTIENPRMWQHLPNVLDEAEIARLLQAAIDCPSRYPHRDQALLELLYATGLRVSEAAGLHQSDVRHDLGIVRCLGKGRRERIVPISRRCLEMIATYETEERPRLARLRRTDRLFLSRSGKALGREVIAAMVQKYARLAGLPGQITPHMLRHSFATHMLRGGADLRVVQEILGHVKLTTTEIYTHIDRSDLKRQHKRYHPRG